MSEIAVELRKIAGVKKAEVIRPVFDGVAIDNTFFP